MIRASSRCLANISLCKSWQNKQGEQSARRIHFTTQLTVQLRLPLIAVFVQRVGETLLNLKNLVRNIDRAGASMMIFVLINGTGDGLALFVAQIVAKSASSIPKPGGPEQKGERESR